MLLLLILASTIAQPESLGPGDHQRSLSIGERQRDYLLHVPKSYDGTRAVPVVLAFHGGGSNPEQMVDFCGLNETADKHGFIVVYPRGTGRVEQFLTFNGGNCCGYAQRYKIDDIAFANAVLDDLAKAVRVDPRRVYSTGMSNGAIMSYRLASELSHRIAAIAPVGGPMGTETCQPRRPVPVIHFHGTDDRFAPFTGGKGKGMSGTVFYSVEHSINAWVKANACNEKPKLIRVKDRAQDGTTATIKTYSDGKDGAEVILVEIQGAGHTWPGREPTFAFLGKSTKNISANELMWEFFKRHPMP